MNAFPSLLEQNFQINVITFGENLSAYTQKKLQDIVCTHIIVGAASGPGVHRKIKNILFEMNEKSSANSDESESREKALLLRAHIRNKLKKKAAPEKEMQKQKRGYTFTISENDVVENKEDRLRRMYQESDTRERANSENASSENTNSEDASTIWPELDLKHDDEREDYGSIEKKFIKTEEDDLVTRLEMNANQNSEDDETLESLMAIGKASLEKSKVDGSFTSRTPVIMGNHKDVNFTKVTNVKNKNLNNKSSDRELNIDSVSSTSRVASSTDTREKIVQEMEHFIIQSARTAADALIPPVTDMTLSTSCTVWPVTCKDMTGFIVISHGGTAQDESKYNSRFIDLVRQEGPKICSTFEVDDHLISNLEHVDLKHKVDGELFTATIPSGHDEIIVKFIEAHSAVPSLNIDSSQERARIDASELVTDLAPGADLYLYMPKNNRYFIYLKMNGTLSPKQKEKLEETNAAIFISSRDVNQYSKTFIKNTTIQKIRDLKHKNKKAS